MNKYEAMIIFPEQLKDNVLEEAIGKIKAEIKKVGGEVDSATRLGKRTFARKLKKQDAGHYAVLLMKLPGDQVAPLLARFKLNEEVFRIQIVRAPENAVVATATAGGEAKAHAQS